MRPLKKGWPSTESQAIELDFSYIQFGMRGIGDHEPIVTLVPSWATPALG